MQIFVVVECFVLLIISLLFGKKIYHPAVVFSAFYMIMGIFSSLGLRKMFSPSDKVLIIIAIGIFSFVLSCLISGNFALITGASKQEKMYSPENFSIERMTSSSLYYYGFRIMVIIGLFATGIHALRVIFYLANGYSFYSASEIENPFRWAYSHGYSTEWSPNVFFSSIDTILYNRFVKAIMLSTCVIGVIEFYKTMGERWRPLLYATLMFIFDMIASGGARSNLFKLAIGLLFGFFIYVKQFSILSQHSVYYATRRKKLRRIVIRLTIVLVVAVAALTSIRRSSNSISRVLWELYQYFGYCFTFMSEQLKNFDGKFTYGYVFFGAIFSFPMQFLDLVGIPIPAKYQIANGLSGALSEWIRVGENNLFNAYPTLFYYFFIDGGIVAVILESVLYGLICGVIFHKSKQGESEMYSALLLLAILGIVDSMHAFQFSGFASALAYLLVVYYCGPCKKIKFTIG